MLQRVLGWDAAQMIPVIVIAPANDSELPEESFKAFLDQPSEKQGPFFQYEAHQERTYPTVFNRADFFKLGKSRFMYVKLGSEAMPQDSRLLSSFEAEIKTRFGVKDWSSPGIKRPVVYIFLPEFMESNHCITQYARRLEDHVALRIFSKGLQIFSRDESSLIYGPDFYPEEIYEKMRKYCYWQFYQKRKRENQPGFFGFFGVPESFRAAKLFAQKIPVRRTAFGRFKMSETVNEYAWFYPVRRSLGKAPYHFIRRSANGSKEGAVAIPVKTKPSAEDPLTLKILEDLKPRGPGSGSSIAQ